MEDKKVKESVKVKEEPVKFTKDQILRKHEFCHATFVLKAVLKDDKRYTIEEVKNILNK